LQSLLEAARWAASSYNEQPWRYMIAQKEQTENFAQLLSCLEPINQKWAKGAPVLMLSFMHTAFTRNQKPNRVAMHDVGAASAELTLEAMRHGVFVHQMGGILLDRIREVYHVPADFDPVAGLALGYPGDVNQLPEPFRKPEQEPRTRKSPTELFFSHLWGEAADFIKDAV